MSAGGGSFPIAFLLQVQGDQEVKSKIQSVGGAFQNFGTQAETVNTQAAKLKPNFSEAALGISAAASAGASLYFQFDNLEKASLRVETAEKNLKNARAASIGATATLIALTERGITSGNQYEQAVLRQEAAQEQLAIAEQRVNIMQGDLSQAQTQFALTVVPTVIGAVSSMTMAVRGLGFGMVTTGVQANVVSTGVQKVGIASRMAQLAMGPFGWAMLAIGTVFTLVATNAFGIRDALDSFAKKVQEIFPFLKPVFDFFRTIASTLFPDAKEETKDLSQTMDSEFTNIAATVDKSSLQQEMSLQALSGQFADTNIVASTEMSSLASNVEKESDRIANAAKKAKKAMADIGASSPSTNFAPTPAASGSGSSSDYRLVPNPIGAPISVYDPMLGGKRASELKAEIQNPTVMNTALTASRYSALMGNNSNTNVTVLLDGKEIAAKISKRRLGDEILGRT